MRAITLVLVCMCTLWVSAASAQETSACKGNRDCGSSQFCDWQPGKCKQGVGTCKAKPENCVFQYAPVCGCNGRTYANACFAAKNGTSVATKGKCSGPTPSGCGSNDQCAADEFCERPPGDCNTKGSCQERPSSCNGGVFPVCGCNGVTYDSACEARMNGVNIAAPGQCN